MQKAPIPVPRGLSETEVCTPVLMILRRYIPLGPWPGDGSIVVLTAEIDSMQGWMRERLAEMSAACSHLRSNFEHIVRTMFV